MDEIDREFDEAGEHLAHCKVAFDHEKMRNTPTDFRERVAATKSFSRALVALNQAEERMRKAAVAKFTPERTDDA